MRLLHCRRLFLGGLALAALITSGAAEPAAPAIAWHAWSAEIFAQARREHKCVLLDLEAGWCHWCHVMDETTYRDRAVVRLISAQYLAVRVDQDARPDLANRYEDYGWPATVIYGPDGAELVKRQGYLEPRAMVALLQAVIDDPTPGPSVRAEAPVVAATSTTLGDARRTALFQAWSDGYDERAGGWGFSHKYLDGDSVELALRQSGRGDERAAQRARDTLRLQRRLLDPAWGGLYQYSAGGDWNEPHFEKILAVQADNLRICALAYARWHDPADLETAHAIHRYLRTFLLGSDGAFYTSQDADLVPGAHSADYFALDDRARRARGVPRIDRHCYARENGWVISALCELAAATGEADDRREAEQAVRWVLANRALPGGGFRHDEHDVAGPYLGDTLAMGRACLALHELTQDRAWLDRAAAAAGFVAQHFGRGTEAGFASSETTGNALPAPRPQFDENVGVARWATALAAATGREEHCALAASALRWLAAPGLAEERRFYVAGLLLAEEDARTPPVHVAVVGPRDDPAAQAMFAAALRLPEAHRLVEWWDRREGPPPRGEDIYPVMNRAVAFLCADGACSAPITDATALAMRLAKVR